MQENVESFANYFGIEHCFEFTITAPRLDPAEFSRRMNSFVTNALRDKMPARIGVVEPHKSGHAHQHTLVAVPFTSPDFNHDALAASREAYRQKNFKLSAILWQRVRASMSEEHRAMWDWLQAELPKFGLGKQIGFSPVRETPRALACYFGKYLAKGIAEKPAAWKRVRLVRYSGTNGREIPAWKNSSPLRSGNSLHDQNRRDKLRVVAREFGATTPAEVQAVLGTHWHFHGRALLERVQLPVYRSFLHADADKLRVTIPVDADWYTVDAGPLGDCTALRLPDWAFLPWTPPADLARPDAVSPRECALALLDQAAPFRPAAAGRAALLRAFPGPVVPTGSARN